MRYAKKISLLLCSLMFLCLSVPVMAQTRSSSLVYQYFEDVPAWGGTYFKITESARTLKVTDGGVATFKGSTSAVLRPSAQLVNSNNDARSDYIQISKNNVIYYTTLRNAVKNYYYYPRVKSNSLEPGRIDIGLWYSSDEVK